MLPTSAPPTPRPGHSERSEESQPVTIAPADEIPRCARDDKLVWPHVALQNRRDDLLDSPIALQEFRLLPQRVAVAVEYHLTLHEDDITVGNRGYRGKVLVDDDGRNAGAADRFDDAPDFTRDHGRQAFRR